MKSIPFTFIWEPTSPARVPKNLPFLPLSLKWNGLRRVSKLWLDIDTAHNFQLKLSTSFTLRVLFFLQVVHRETQTPSWCVEVCVNTGDTARAPVSLYWVSGYLLLSKYVIYQILRPPFWSWKRCERVNTFGKINEDVTLTLEIFLAISAKWAKVVLKNATKMRWKSLAV